MLRLWPLLSILWAGLAMVAAPDAAGEPAARKEYDVKAAYLFNFARFVEWPDGSLPDDGDPFRIAIVGDDPFDGALEKVIAGKTIRGRSLLIERIEDPDRLSEFHLAFVGSSENRRLAEIFDALNGRPVLTVGETDRFFRLGGMIRFTVVGGRVQFEINLGAAKKPGLRVSSKLLAVASHVENREVESS